MLILVLVCFLCFVSCGILCITLRKTGATEVRYNKMDGIMTIQETQEGNAKDYLAKTAANPAIETVPSETQDAAYSEIVSAESTEASVPTEGEVIIALAANSDSRYPGLILTQEDKDLLINILWLEARGEPFEGQQGIAEIVFNRVVNERYFPDTIREVIFDDEVAIQFSTSRKLHMARPSEAQYEVLSSAIEQALNGPYVLPVEVVFFGVEPENDNVWGSIGGHCFCYPWYP